MGPGSQLVRIQNFFAKIYPLMEEALEVGKVPPPRNSQPSQGLMNNWFPLRLAIKLLFLRGVRWGWGGWLTSHASQEDDYDRLPMPTGRPVERALDFPGFPGCPVVAWPKPQGPSSSGRDWFKATSKTKISAGGGSSCKEAWEEERERHGALNSELQNLTLPLCWL